MEKEGIPSMDMKLYCFRVGVIAFHAPMPEVEIPMYVYLIEHPKGLILVDTGMNILWPDKFAVMQEDDLIVPQLAKLGYNPVDIDYVVISHMHFDHAGNMASFPNATFIVRREELRSAWWPIAGDDGGYCYRDYENTRDFKFIQLEDDEDYDVFLDGRIVLIDTRGHSRGHQSVVVDLPNTGKVILGIDAAPGKEALMSGSSSRSVDNWAAVRSIQKLKHLNDCGGLMLYAHDPGNPPEKLAPLYYD